MAWKGRLSQVLYSHPPNLGPRNSFLVVCKMSHRVQFVHSRIMEWKSLTRCPRVPPSSASPIGWSVIVPSKCSSGARKLEVGLWTEVCRAALEQRLDCHAAGPLWGHSLALSGPMIHWPPRTPLDHPKCQWAVCRRPPTIHHLMIEKEAREINQNRGLACPTL